MRIIYTQRYEDIVTAVVATLEKAGASHLPILPLELAEKLGIKVRRYSEAGAEKKAIFLSLQKDGFSFRYTKDFVIVQTPRAFYFNIKKYEKYEKRGNLFMAAFPPP